MTVPPLPAKDAVEVKISLNDPPPGTKTAPHYKPRETLSEIPDRPDKRSAARKESDIQALVVGKIPLGTKYYLVRRISDREGWKEIHYRPQNSSRRVWADMTMELGHYKEDGKTVTVVAIFEMDRKGDGEYLSQVRIEKAMDLKDD